MLSATGFWDEFFIFYFWKVTAFTQIAAITNFYITVILS